jgi:hypothetical protein
MSPRHPLSGVDEALRQAHDAIEGLAGELRRLGERHAGDHDVLHMSRTLGLRLDEAAVRLASHGEGLSALDPDPEQTGGPLAALREKTSQLLGSRPTAGALLLADLRRLLVTVADGDVTCTILVQGAHAAKDAELLDTASTVQETVERTRRWALTRLKATAPQVLAGPR